MNDIIFWKLMAGFLASAWLTKILYIYFLQKEIKYYKELLEIDPKQQVDRLLTVLQKRGLLRNKGKSHERRDN